MNKIAQEGLQVDYNNLIADTTPNFSSTTTIGDIVARLIPYFFFFAGVLLLLYLIMGGFLLMTSKGDPKAISAAKNKITYGLVGFIIVFAAYWIVQVLGMFLGLPDIGNVF